jgi:hypothetical protein
MINCINTSLKFIFIYHDIYIYRPWIEKNIPFIRLREGYTVNTVRVLDNEIRVKLTMPWKFHTFIHYTVFSVWPSNNKPEACKCRVEVSVEGPYDIIYDIICQTNKQFSSHYRYF